MKPVALSALAGVLLILGVVPASQAVEILRWERLPLPSTPTTAARLTRRCRTSSRAARATWG